ncbi:MAG TPA: DUF6788 family protein [Clostridia bacterium]|nr:DUF6788 family protein [Clostridia bacterium]
MKKTLNLEELYREYAALATELSTLKWVSHGYAQNRGRGAGGPCYQWTRKEKGKTISVAMSVEQYEAMAEAIANGKKAKQILRRMGQISRRIIFSTLPDTKRSKPLTDEVLGLS